MNSVHELHAGPSDAAERYPFRHRWSTLPGLTGGQRTVPVSARRAERPPRPHPAATRRRGLRWSGPTADPAPPSPARHRPSRTYTWRRETCSLAAASSASAGPTVSFAANGPITSACRTAVSHTRTGAVSTPRSATGPSATRKPSAAQAASGCPESSQSLALGGKPPAHPCIRLWTFTFRASLPRQFSACMASRSMGERSRRTVPACTRHCASPDSPAARGGDHGAPECHYAPFRRGMP